MCPHLDQGGEPTNIVILAGGQCSPDVKRKYGVAFRCELPFGGGTMLDRVISAVETLGDLIVVGGPAMKTYKRVEAGNSFVESLSSGLSAVTTERFLLVTADLPFLTKTAVEDFVKRSDFSAGLNYSVIPADVCERRFPGMERTSLRTKVGRLTGGNIAVANTADLKSALPLLDKAYAMRKSPLKLARLVGVGTLFRIALGQVFPQILAIRPLEIAVSRLVGTSVRAIVSSYPEIGADVDNETQYEAALDLWNSQTVADN